MNVQFIKLELWAILILRETNSFMYVLIECPVVWYLVLVTFVSLKLLLWVQSFVDNGLEAKMLRNHL